MLIVKHLTKVYQNNGDSVEALKDVNLKFPDSGLITITGKSGSGKTTLLNIIGCIDSPTEGNVIYNDTAVLNNGYEDIFRRDIISIVFQKELFFNNKSSYENINIVCEMQKKKLDVDKLNMSLNKIDLYRQMNKYPNQLSTGQLQRVSLLRGLLKDSKIILIDEPTSNLDHETELLVFELLKEASKTKLVVLVTHNEKYAKYYSDRIIKMKNGRIVSDDYFSFQRKSISIQNEGVIVSPFYEISKSEWKFLLETLMVKKTLLLKINESKLEKDKEKVDYHLPKDKDYMHEKQEIITNNSNLRDIFSYSLLFLTSKKIKESLSIILTSILLILTLVLIFLLNYNQTDFIYETFKENEMDYINFTYKDFSTPPFIFNDVRIHEIEEISGESIERLINFNEQIILSGSNETHDFSFFNDYKIIGIHIADIDKIELIAGNYPIATEILITDYTAKLLMLNYDGVNSFNDLVNNWINFGDFSYFVTGIVKTDYENYLYLINDINIDEYIESNEYIEFEKYKNDYLLRFYQTSNVIDDLLESKIIKYVPINGGERYINVEFMDSIESLNIDVFEDLTRNGVLISNDLYEQIYTDSTAINIKVSNEYYSIKGVVEDSECRNKIIFTNENEYHQFLNKYYSINNIIVKVESENIINYMQQIGLKHNTIISSELDTILSFTMFIDGFSNNIIIILFVFIIISIYYFFFQLYSSNRKKIGLLKVFGLRDKELKFISYILYLIYCSFVVALLVIFHSLFKRNVNDYVSKELGSKIIFVVKTNELLVLFIIGFAVAALIISMGVSIFIRKIKIVNLIN